MICSVADCQKENHPKYPTRCWIHRAKKWAAEPVAEQKKEKSELIQAGKEIVETDIVPPTSMSPNATSIPATQPDSAPIVEETKNISIFAKCRAFLKERDNGRWEETYRFKDRETGKYLHPLMRDMSLLRVEDGAIKKAGGKGHCRFYWIYNPKDALAFVEHVGLRLRGECHEIIISPRCRFFLDIDLKLDEMEKCDIAEAMQYPLEEDGDEIKTMESVSLKLAKLYAQSIKISLEENSALEELDRFDWMATTRNRKLDNDGFKISIHLITNLMLPHEVCSAIANDIQTKTIAEFLDISESIADLMSGAIDPAQYRKHGSLALQYGVKNGNQSLIIRDYVVPGQSYFLTKGGMNIIEDVDPKNYDVKAVSTFTAEANGDFVKQALEHVDKIPDYNKNVFDLSVSRLRGSCMIAKRCAPSNCSICNRRHDNDNTLKLFFNSDKGFATWNCIRSKSKSKCFFRIEEPVESPADEDIETFAKRDVAAPVEKKPTKAKHVMEDPFDGEDMPRPDETDDEGGVSQDLYDFDLDDEDEVRSNPELHCSMTYDLCKLMKPSWFRDSKNTWNLSRALYQMPLSDPEVMRKTYALILAHHGGEWFNKKTAISQYISDGPSTGFAVMSLGKIKSIAGGSNAEGYKAWKAKYEPEPIKEENSKSADDSERKSKKPSVVLKQKMIDIVRDTYRREFSTGVIFQKKTDYYYTRKFADPREFLNYIFIDDEMYQMCSQSDHKELLHFIKDVAHPEFMFMTLDHSYMGFKNGVYCLDDGTFCEGADIPKNIQVRVYYDMDWNVPVETPLLDAFFARQFNLETTEFIHFMLGRTLTKLKDKFDFMVMLFGLGGTGKSLLMNLICYAFGSAQVGIFGSTYQDRFGMSEFATKQIVASDDMPRNIAKTLPKSDFLSMQSRGRISCPVKGKNSIEVDSWDIPTIINSNDMPNYSDTSGEIIRRIMIINFDNAIPDDEKDVCLEDKIKSTEFCAFIHRCRSTYLRYCKDYAGRNAYTFCPHSFLESRDMLRGSSNESYQFANAHLKYVAPQEGKPSAIIPKAELKEMFNAYIKEKYNLSRPGKQTLDLESLVSADPRIKHSAINICKSCRNKHAKNCCAKYSRTNRSKAEFVVNAMYSYNASNE